MLINIDAKGLEWVAGTYLSQDPVAMMEILEGKDQHGDNQAQFSLPSRLIAKKFVFRLIYGGTEYSYAIDPDFMEVSDNPKFWAQVIERFYNKYRGWAAWHESLMHEATTTKKIKMLTGRVYEFEPIKNKRGGLEWPRTTILNYPVQGLGADLMAICRTSFYRRFKENKLVGELVATVHDSIVVDTISSNLDPICRMITEVFRDIPKNFKRLFGHEFNLPLVCEVQYGRNLYDMLDVDMSKYK